MVIGVTDVEVWDIGIETVVEFIIGVADDKVSPSDVCDTSGITVVGQAGNEVVEFIDNDVILAPLTPFVVGATVVLTTVVDIVIGPAVGVDISDTGIEVVAFIINGVNDDEVIPSDVCDISGIDVVGQAGNEVVEFIDSGAMLEPLKPLDDWVVEDEAVIDWIVGNRNIMGTIFIGVVEVFSVSGAKVETVVVGGGIVELDVDVSGAIVEWIGASDGIKSVVDDDGVVIISARELMSLSCNVVVSIVISVVEDFGVLVTQVLLTITISIGGGVTLRCHNWQQYFFIPVSHSKPIF